MTIVILIVVVLVLIGLACWAGRDPNPPGGSAGDSTGAKWGTGWQ